MFNHIKNIKIKGGPFTELLDLELIPSRLNLLYGRNGSGKSTIAQCIKRLGKEADDSGYFSETTPALDEEQSKNVYVFDEDFVYNNLRMENENGLSSIVMLGKQVELDEKLKVMEDHFKKLENIIAECSQELETLHDQSNPNSLTRLHNEIKDRLSADDGWADREKQIKGNQIKSPVSKALIEELSKLKPSTNDASLKTLYEEKMRTIQAIKKGGGELDNLSPSIVCSSVDSAKILLEKHINEPHLDSRDKAIIELVRSEYGVYLDKVHPVFDNPELDVCPLCLRPMELYDKQRLFAMIEQFFNKESEEYKKELDQYIERLQYWKPLELSEALQSILDKRTLNELRKIENNLQASYKELLASFEEKKKNVYGISIYWNWSELSSNQDAYISIMVVINGKIDEYNANVRHFRDLRKELMDLNKLISAKELKSQFTRYRRIQENEQMISGKKGEAERRLQQLSQEISEVRAQKNQVSIALDFINESLAYIFFNNKRLVLENSNGKYMLKSNGRKVKPKDVSTGERNAIALCYFFAKLFEHHEKETKYADERLVVLDDPITSFDKENKVGMMTFLRWQIDEIYKGNSNSKMLIMSHDLMTIFDIQKVYNDIADKDYTILELKDRTTTNRHLFKKERNEYQKIIDDVFELANNSDSKIDLLSIGNKMRRMEEAYASFIGNKQFEKMLHDNEFLQRVPEEKRAFYKNFMCRLILNTESHAEEKAYDMNAFSAMFNEQEMKETAKHLLLLFYYVDSYHLKSYLGDGKYEMVKQWE